MNDYVNYAEEAEIRAEVQKLLERDAAEGMEHFTRLFASMVGEMVLLDRPPSERLAIYMANPPIMPGTPPVPPPDREGVFPQWTAMAAEFPAHYLELCDDAGDLLAKWQKGDLQPKVIA
ncbi:MAG: hypothetical protein E6Q97_20975 [Desulfurellales bacterium]|nr:MAG: hypothetical protein E6Q97_20975 [Desulfurellales bacterium]